MQPITEQDLTRWHHDGYVVFRELIPTALLGDLRKQAAIAKEIIRAEKGGQVQRLQPVSNYADRIDQQVFQDYVDLPELREAFDIVVTPEHHCSDLGVLGIFFEPQDRPWGSGWHRDANEESSGLTREQFQRMLSNPMLSLQVNCPLYDDCSTWYVRGSHHRALDLPGETAAAASFEAACKDPEASFEDCERAWQRHTTGMPGAIQFVLRAGDFALYRPLGWHQGNYHPQRPRATMHHLVASDKYYRWWHAWIKGQPADFTGVLD